MSPLAHLPTVLLACSAAVLATAGCANNQHTAGSSSTTDRPITQEEVMAAQRAWGDGIVDISRVYAEGGDAKARATEHIESLYAYGNTIVLFAPTLASEDQFRGSFDGALSYFIGREGTEDTGFAIKGWTNVRFENEGIHIGSELAMAMGNYFFTDPDGEETMVEYSFGYVRGQDGDLEIMLQHSSLPYGSWE
ncbi:MAG: phosphoribosyl-AMP cyclohydrolase [Planctomycetota bacterium]|nr:phosphoribosyl-AMP cyclohydrolase [Planctomycetota bacterium]